MLLYNRCNILPCDLWKLPPSCTLCGINNKRNCFCVWRSHKMGSSVCGTEQGVSDTIQHRPAVGCSPEPEQLTPKIINPPGHGHRSCLFPGAVLALPQWKMPFFTRIPNAFAFCVCVLLTFPLFCKGHSINQRFQKLQRGFWHRVLTQQETALEITGNVILEEEERVNVGEHCSMCRTRKSRQAPIPRFPWLQARHLG